MPAKIHQPFMLHQSPCSVPGTRRTNATPLPVRSALAGHMITRCRRNVIANSITAHVSSETRIWAIESWKPNAVWPRTCSEMITAARCSRGSRTVGSRTGYAVPRIRSVGRRRSGQGRRAHRRHGTGAGSPVQARFPARTTRSAAAVLRRSSGPLLYSLKHASTFAPALDTASRGDMCAREPTDFEAGDDPPPRRDGRSERDARGGDRASTRPTTSTTPAASRSSRGSTRTPLHETVRAGARGAREPRASRCRRRRRRARATAPAS